MAAVNPATEPSRLRRAVLALGGVGLALIAPGVRAETVTGSGRSSTEHRSAGGFQAIAAHGDLTLVLRQGTQEGIALRGDDNVLPLIETRVVGRDGLATLEIGLKRGVRLRGAAPVVATIDLISLQALSVAGAGEIACEALKTPRLRLTVAGSSDVRMSQLKTESLAVEVAGSGRLGFGGEASRVEFSISGSGHVEAGALKADDVTISVAGSGDARVHANRTLRVSVAGSGDVVYTGEPVVTSSIAGSGHVRRL